MLDFIPKLTTEKARRYAVERVLASHPSLRCPAIEPCLVDHRKHTRWNQRLEEGRDGESGLRAHREPHSGVQLVVGMVIVEVVVAGVGGG